jgi:hypothetical protein
VSDTSNSTFAERKASRLKQMTAGDARNKAVTTAPADDRLNDSATDVEVPEAPVRPSTKQTGR